MTKNLWRCVILTAAFVAHANGLRPSFRKELLQTDSEIPDSTTPRFTQSRSKFNLFIFLTNLLFPGQSPRIVKNQFQTGGCPGWYLDTTSTNQRIENDWIYNNGWSYRPQESTIAFNAYSEGKEVPHPFLFFWLPRRISAKDALIKRNFFCQNTSMQADISLQGAKEAGLLFRVVGERNFWAVMARDGDGIKLIRVKEGEPQLKLHLTDIMIKQNTFYTISVQEWMGDVVLTAMETPDGKPVEARYKMKSEEEVRPTFYKDAQGAVGLMANFGPAVFRNAFMGDVNWAPNTGSPGKLSEIMNEMKPEDHELPLSRDRGILWELPDDLKSWCPEGSICAGNPYL